MLGAILLAGLVLRGWYLWEVVHAPDFAAPQQDPAVMDYHARGIVTGDWTLPPGAEGEPEIRTTPYFRPPGHAYFLAAVYFLTKGSYLAPRVVNMLLGLASAYLMFLLGRRVYGSRVGLIAAFFMSTYWGFIFWEGELNDPALFIFLGTLLMNVLAWWAEKLRVRWAALAGLIVGCYALMRPNILLFGPFIAAWMLWIAYRRGLVKRVIASWAVLALIPFLVILPVTIRNYVASGEFVPISTYFGENFLIGNSDEADGVTPWTPYLQKLEGTGNWSVWVYVNAVRGLGRELGIKPMPHAEASRQFFNRTWAYVKQHKLRTLELMARKAVLFWTPVEITCNKVVQYEKEFYPPLKYLPGFPSALALSVLGVAMYLRDLRRRNVLTAAGNPPLKGGRNTALGFPIEMSLLMGAFVFVYFVSFLPFFVNGRARVPIIPFCFLAGAYGLARIIEFIGARQFLKTGGWIAALLALYGLASIQYIKFEPDRSRWYYQRADSYLRIGELDKAIDEASHLLNRPDTASYMNMRLARAFGKEGRTEEAFAQLMEALQNHPTDPDVQCSGAAELINLGKIPEGIAHYTNTLHLSPDDWRAHNNLGALLEDQGQFDDALHHFQEAVRIAPNEPLARNNLGNLWLRIGTPESLALAVDNFRKAIEVDPKQQDYHYNLAVALARSGRVDEAIARYNVALELNPDDARAHNNLGLLLADGGLYDEAARHYAAALAIVPDYVLVYANLGNMLAKQGKVDEGIKAYEQGLAIHPEDAGLHNGLGYLCATHGRIEEARRHYDEALRLAPNFPLAHNNLGNLFAEQGNVSEALRHYALALDIDPRDRFAHWNIADLLARQEKYDDAIAHYLQAIENNPVNSFILNNLGNALVRKVRFDEAIQYYKKALQLDPKFVRAYCNLGLVLQGLGRNAEAADCFKKALELDPDDATAKDGLKRVSGSGVRVP